MRMSLIYQEKSSSGCDGSPELKNNKKIETRKKLKLIKELVRIQCPMIEEYRHQNLDNGEAGLSFPAQPRQCRLENAPCDCLAGQSCADNHGTVSRVLGFVQLNHLGDRLRQRL